MNPRPAPEAVPGSYHWLTSPYAVPKWRVGVWDGQRWAIPFYSLNHNPADMNCWTYGGPATTPDDPGIIPDYRGDPDIKSQLNQTIKSLEITIELMQDPLVQDICAFPDALIQRAKLVLMEHKAQVFTPPVLAELVKDLIEEVAKIINETVQA
jgi:hypothetical protein